MATTVANLLTRLAYRLNEDSSPSDSNENARRISFLSEAQRKVMGENYWWFSNGVASLPTVSGQEIYDLESDFRDMIEVRVDEKVCQPIPQPDVYSNYDYPPLSYQYDGILDRYWVFGENEFHLLPVPASAPSAVSVTITRSGTTATATAAHSLKVGNYVTIAGADQSDYNGVFRVTNTTTTTFNFTVENSPVTPATGTITATKRNVVYRYWKKHTDFSTSTDTTIIPDRYSDILIAFALSRKLTGAIEDERGSMSDAIEEYNQILSDMKKENNRKKFYFKQLIPKGSNVL